jgi:hypothetical protein
MRIDGNCLAGVFCVSQPLGCPRWRIWDSWCGRGWGVFSKFIKEVIGMPSIFQTRHPLWSIVRLSVLKPDTPHPLPHQESHIRHRGHSFLIPILIIFDLGYLFQSDSDNFLFRGICFNPIQIISYSGYQFHSHSIN